jgi:glutathione S-transferase
MPSPKCTSSFFQFTALNLKGIDYEYKAVHLVQDGGEQNKEEFRAVNPLGQVC